MQNFVAILWGVLEKMTLEVAIFGTFPDISELKWSLPLFLSCRSCRVTVPVLIVSVKPEARRSFG